MAACFAFGSKEQAKKRERAHARRPDLTLLHVLFLFFNDSFYISSYSRLECYSTTQYLSNTKLSQYIICVDFLQKMLFKSWPRAVDKSFTYHTTAS